MKKEDKFVNWVKIKADAVGQERGGAYLEKFWILFMMISPWALSVSLKQMPMLYFSFLLMNAKFRFNENCPTPIRGSMWSVDTCHFFADDSTDVWLNRNTQLPKNDHDVHGDNAHHWGVGCRSYQIWNKPPLKNISTTGPFPFQWPYSFETKWRFISVSLVVNHQRFLAFLIIFWKGQSFS